MGKNLNSKWKLKQEEDYWSLQGIWGQLCLFLGVLFLGIGSKSSEFVDVSLRGWCADGALLCAACYSPRLPHWALGFASTLCRAQPGQPAPGSHLHSSGCCRSCDGSYNPGKMLITKLGTDEAFNL